MNNYYEILSKLESVCPMEFHEPASVYEINSIRMEVPNNLIELLLITNGVEINIPGTRIYSVQEYIDHAENSNGPNPIGHFNFGDPLYMSSDGQVYQIDHETGDEFLRWPSLSDFLLEELHNSEVRQ